MSETGGPPLTTLRRSAKQKRSIERVDAILDGAQMELVTLGSAEHLSTTRLSKRCGLPVASIYRYFADRWAIVGALIDREIAAIDQEIVAELERREVIRLPDLLELFVETHYKHFKKQPGSIVMWFGARGSQTVTARVAGRYLDMARWIQEGSHAAGLADGYPQWGGEALVWVCDRTFEVMFREKRSEEEERAIMREAVEMMSAQMCKYATPEGLSGIPASEFLELAGPFAPRTAQ